METEKWTPAIYWLTKASQSGSSDSQHSLGLYLLWGENVGKDVKKARYWLAEAARSGDTDAAFVLGASYMGDDQIGSGDVDFVSARYWLEIAEAAGNVKAVELIADGILYENRQARKLEESQRLVEAGKTRQKRERLKRVEAQAIEVYQARRPKRSSLAESLVGGFFDALGQGIGLALSAKIDKELGVNSYDSNNLSLQEIEEASRRGMRNALRKQQRIKSLNTTPSIGYDN